MGSRLLYLLAAAVVVMALYICLLLVEQLQKMTRYQMEMAWKREQAVSVCVTLEGYIAKVPERCKI